MTDDDQPQQRLKLVIYGCLLVAVLAGIWAARPVYRGWKKQRYLARASEFLARTDYKNAALSARQVLALDPANLPAWQVMASLTEQLRSPELLACRQRIVDIEPENPTNQIALANAAMMFGEFARAESALRRVPETNRNTLEFHQAAAMVLAAQKKLAEAEAQFAAALKLSPTNHLLQLNRAVILLQVRDTNAVAEGMQTLGRYVNDSKYRRMALQNLAQAYLHAGDFDAAIARARELAEGTNGSFADQMLLLSVLREAKSPEFAKHLASLKTAAVAAGPEQVQALASWLMTAGLADDASQWLASLPAELQSQQRVSMALADLQLARRDWPALERLTKSAKWGEADFLRLAMQARALREQGQTMSATSAWLDAVRAAGNNGKMLSVLARMAADWRWTREEDELLWTLVERHPGERWALTALNDRYTQAADTHGLQRLFTLLVDRNPDDLAAKNNLAVTSLLLGLQRDRAHALAREVFAKYPSNEVCASTYAFSLYLQGRRDEALKAFAAVPQQALEQPSVAIYYGLVLGTNSPVEAARYLDLAARGRLLPEERDLLVRARKEL